MKLVPTFKDFPAPTAIFKDFQGACEPWKLNPSEESFRSKMILFCKKDIKTEHEQNAFVTNFFSFAD